jgi:ABC-2 type transport system permease protein
MRRYLTIYALLARNSLIREMNFKANFLLWICVELLWFAGQLAFIEVLYGQVDSIAGWTKWQVVALVGAHQVTSQIFQGLFYVNLSHLPDLVRTGRLDIMLTQPIDAQFAVSTKQVSFDSLLNALVSIGIIIFALARLHVVPSIGSIALAITAIGFGVAVHYAVLFALSCIAFWSIRAGFISGYFNLFMIGRFPEKVFPRGGAFRFIFTWIVPVIWVSNVPAQALARPFESPWPGIAELATGTFLVVLLTRRLWNFALTRYGSASS